MALRKTPGEEKKKPGINFVMYIPIRWSVSTEIKVKNDFELKVANEENKNITTKTKEMLFKNLKVKNERELVDKYLEIKDKIEEIKDIIRKKLGLRNSEFSNFMDEEIKKYNEK